MNILLSTCDHLGDSVVLTAAIHDAKLAFPDIAFDYEGNYGDVFLHNPDITPFEHSRHCNRIRVTYGKGHQTAERGNLCEGMVKTLSYELEPYTEMFFEIKSSAPYLYLTDEEKSRDFGIPKPYCIINSNSQNRSEVKAYPYYQRIINILCEKGITPVLIGGDMKRDITEKLDGCVDLRQQTSIRDLFSLVWQCDSVVSPASGVIHIAAAFNKRALCIIGAREPAKLTKYPSVIHASSTCGAYNSSIGCMKFHFHRDKGGCNKLKVVNGKLYSDCMCAVPSSVINNLYP